jgi:hypothetical protein
MTSVIAANQTAPRNTATVTEEESPVIANVTVLTAIIVR